MSRRIDYRSDKRRRSVIEQGYESWNGSVTGDGLGKLDRSEYDPRNRTTGSPQNAKRKPTEGTEQPPRRKNSNSKAKRIHPESPEGKKIAEEALKAAAVRQRVQPSSQNWPDPTRLGSSGPHRAPLTPPRSPSPSSSRHPRGEIHLTSAIGTSAQNSASMPRRPDRPKTNRWLLWSIPVLLGLALIWAGR